MSQNAAELTVQDLRNMRRSFSRQELLDLIATRPGATELEQAPASFDIALLVKALNNW